ncbi:methyl-accepting chemotaxis protein [Pseudomaricurvus alkylphenolicus]|uniref:methyl-accepting chemotaxis protein n=1 Tax=Pseudomaricurvus alkylphenolicus TaxID=1306991 RepID=UPI001423C7CB|nr:methyl-accepting chemotaxis protein [Pseudomaricurvus alkylphenolicus]NIB40000.1 methyl-accepting chemotaxis protein [Pseudomaricurvus alkylphenolicus]
MILAPARILLRALGVRSGCALLLVLFASLAITLAQPQWSAVRWGLLLSLVYLSFGFIYVLRSSLLATAEILEKLDLDAGGNGEDLILESDGLLVDVDRSLLLLASKERRLNEGFLNTVSEIGFSASELNSNSELLASNTLQQSQATNSIAAAVTEISHSIEEVSGRIQGAYHSADETNQLGCEGMAAVEAMKAQMEEVSRGASDTFEQMSQLNDKTQQVASMSTVIRDIAEQTNLLALNAAIEAARAGEHGRGFAVVAEEVRALATRSYESAQEIGVTVEDIQGSMADVKTSMDGVVARADKTLEQTLGTQDMFAKIAEHTESVSSMVSAISEAASQQNQAVREISENIEEVAVAAGENSRMAVQSSNIAGHLYQLCGQKEEHYA